MTQAPVVGKSGVQPPAAGAFDRDKFLMRQKIVAISERYSIFDEEGRPILFVRREAHLVRQVLAALGAIAAGGLLFIATIALVAFIDAKFPNDALEVIVLLIGGGMALCTLIFLAIVLQAKRHISICTDQNLTNEVLRVFQDTKWQFPVATYTVADGEFNMLALCRKNHLWNMIRKRWQCYDSHGRLLCLVLEDSAFRSILRRLLGSFYGLLRTNFIYLGPDEQTKIGEFNRNFTILDKYVLDLRMDHDRSFDRRLAVALGVLLDTGERR